MYAKVLKTFASRIAKARTFKTGTHVANGLVEVGQKLGMLWVRLERMRRMIIFRIVEERRKDVLLNLLEAKSAGCEQVLQRIGFRIRLS